MAAVSIRPFHLNVPQCELDDLQRRLAATRWPDRETVSIWSQGVPLSAMQSLVHYWQHTYDWRRCESWLNSCNQHIASIDGLDVHFLHIRSKHESAMPMLLMHGWPGSVIEFRKVIGPLTEPETHGGRKEDAFHLVVPSMPGYGFSSKPKQTGVNCERMVAIYGKLMEALCYQRWVAQGGDWGADVAARLGHRSPHGLVALHFNYLWFEWKKHVRDLDRPTEEERWAMGRQKWFEEVEYGYFKLQATRPQTIGYSLADSPAGQAAWIYEKLYTWSDHDGNLEKVFLKDDILDNIMLYWLTNTGASSARIYWEDEDNTAYSIDLPVGVTVFPKEAGVAPREWAERYWGNIVHWKKVHRGGHFAAWEQPEIFVEEVRECFRHVR